jgi:hypothetical protein
MRQLEGECRHLLKFIPDAAAYSGHRYQHHVPAMFRTVERLRARCAQEISRFGEWREDYRKPEEIAEELSTQFSRTCSWLARMVGPTAWGVKDKAH